MNLIDGLGGREPHVFITALTLAFQLVLLWLACVLIFIPVGVLLGLLARIVFESLRFGWQLLGATGLG